MGLANSGLEDLYYPTPRTEAQIRDRAYQDGLDDAAVEIRELKAANAMLSQELAKAHLEMWRLRVQGSCRRCDGDYVL